MEVEQSEVLARIQARHLDRNAKEQKRKISLEVEQKKAGESVEQFSRKLMERKRNVEAKIDKAASVKAEDLPSYFEETMSEIFAIQRFAAECTFFLPPYEVRQARQIVSSLQQSASKTKSELLPRKRFRFRKRRTKKSKPDQTQASDAKAGDAHSAESSSLVETTMHTIESKNNIELKLKEEDIHHKNIKFSSLSNSQVWALFPTNTIRLTDLEKTTIIVGPVSGPVYIERCTDCTFFLPCRQLRVHEVKGCTFYLNVMSKPIIEHCTGVRVGRYNVAYPTLEEELEKAGFSKGTNCWNQVCDFNWLRDQQSPNWSALKPEEEAAPQTFK
uniref:C-CAP/cofactor C-like domain-containing protein n=1 Tax=Lotharella oceanica TaxID=641309 RepID=A0A7S2X9A2_9EUKA|mmetsp:Transcript_18242/g.34536  ORF Transcript_18242/g.34536 Transcript_18242/m.34536 type:complete len:330 (+) Transcript_18242:14-1003(+)